MIEQELGNLLPFEVPFATMLTMVEVDRDDPGFKNPTKFIGPIYSDADAERLKAEKGWTMKKDGDKWRRVVASPQPKRIFEIRPIKWLLEKGTVVIAAGGGGIPTVYEPGRVLRGIEAVIDKDLCSELLARRARCRPLHHGDRRRRSLPRLGQADRQGVPAGQPEGHARATAFRPDRWGRRSKRPATSRR